MTSPQQSRSLRARLGQRPALGAVWLATGSPSLAEIAGRAGPDLVVLDLQHGTSDRPGLESAIGLVAPCRFS